MDIFKSVKEDIAERGWGEIPDLDTLDDTKKEEMELILRRLALAKVLQSDTHSSEINKAAGSFEDSALRLYLLLTCVEILGRLGAESKYVDFSRWLNTKKDPIKKSRNEFIDELVLKYEAEPNSKEKLLILTTEIHDNYKTTHGFRSNFYIFFNNCIDSEMRALICENIWIYKDNPLIPFASLDTIGTDFNDTSQPELEQLTNSRRRWEALKENDRLKEILKVCETIRNEYTHGLIPNKPTQDKYPVFEDIREAVSAIVADKLHYLSDTLFQEQLRSGGNTVTLNGVNCIVNNGTLYIRDSDFNEIDKVGWIEIHKERANVIYDRGDALFVPSINMAIATPGKALTYYLEDWILNAIKNILQNSSH